MSKFNEGDYVKIVYVADGGSVGHTGRITAVLSYPSQAYYRISGYNGLVTEECLEAAVNDPTTASDSMKSQMSEGFVVRQVCLPTGGVWLTNKEPSK